MRVARHVKGSRWARRCSPRRHRPPFSSTGAAAQAPEACPAATINGTAGPDTLIGTAGIDNIAARAPATTS
jgi:hypothetical protein